MVPLRFTTGYIPTHPPGDETRELHARFQVNSAAIRPGSFGERFSSKSSFIRHDVQPAVAVRREGKARLKVVRREIRKIVQHFGHAHAATEIIERVSHRDARAADARLAAEHARVNGDALPVIYTGQGSVRPRKAQLKRQIPSSDAEPDGPRERIA